MARLQILELPEGEGDRRPPFLLVIDQVDDELAEDIAHWPGDIAKRGGAQHVLCFPGTIDIPANEITLSDATDGNVVRLRVEPRLEGFREKVEEEVLYAQGKVTRAADGLRLAHERTDIARDMGRLANHKAAITDALGMDRLRDWGDIRNAAAGLRKQCDARGDAIERVRDLHRPVEHRGQTICWECSGYDFPGQTTDRAPVAYDQCGTLQALNGDQGQT
ncbi:hypothetical protein ACIQ7D_17665 [Streptomyces sp. NPDC096310]|uniref:hypothetical protein n=1 Tax=Streptomyces sp. NPDC096310 TaxID=3366082 RepID=UPI0037FDCEF7